MGRESHPDGSPPKGEDAPYVGREYHPDGSPPKGGDARRAEGVCLYAFWVATFITLLGILLPPIGVIDSSVLIAVGQFILLCATMAGVGDIYLQILNLTKQEKLHKGV